MCGITLLIKVPIKPIMKCVWHAKKAVWIETNRYSWSSIYGGVCGTPKRLFLLGQTWHTTVGVSCRSTLYSDNIYNWNVYFATRAVHPALPRQKKRSDASTDHVSIITLYKMQICWQFYRVPKYLADENYFLVIWSIILTCLWWALSHHSNHPVLLVPSSLNWVL